MVLRVRSPSLSSRLPPRLSLPHEETSLYVILVLRVRAPHPDLSSDGSGAPDADEETTANMILLRRRSYLAGLRRVEYECAREVSCH